MYIENQEKLKTKILANDVILEAFSGSKFYGTDTPDSDSDYIGIYMLPRQILLGMEKMDELDLSTNKTNSKNTSEDEDIKYYSIQKFFQIAYKNGPNAVEMLFTPKKKIIKSSETWELITDNYDLFVSQRVFKSMFGYALTQKQLARTKRDRYISIEKGVEYLERLKESGRDRLFEQEIENLKLITSNYVNKSGRQREYLSNQPLEQVLQSFKDEMDRYGHRAKKAMAEAEFEYRYDWKFASHSIRLLIQCIELAETGKIDFPLKQKDLIMDVKTGKYSIDEMEKLFDDLDDEFNRIKHKTVLRKDPDYHGINKLLIHINQEYLNS